MFVTAVCVLFLIKLRWPKKKSIYEKHIPISGTYNSKTFRPCRHFGFVMQAHDHLWKERKKQIILIYAFYSAHENRTRPTVDFPK